MGCDETFDPKCIGGFNTIGQVDSYDAKDDHSGPPVFYIGFATYKLVDGGTCVVYTTGPSKHAFGDAVNDAIAQNPSSRNISLWQPKVNQQPPTCYPSSRGRNLAIVGLSFFVLAGFSLIFILFGCGSCIREQYCYRRSTYDPPSPASNTATETELVASRL